MKNFTNKFIILAILSISSISLDAQRATKTMFFCCNPSGRCSSQAFDSQSVCTQACGGTNRCEARTVEVATTVTTVSTAPVSNEYVMGTTPNLTPIVGSATIGPLPNRLGPRASTIVRGVPGQPSTQVTTTVIRGTLGGQ